MPPLYIFCAVSLKLLEESRVGSSVSPAAPGAKEDAMKDDELLARLRTRHASDLRSCFPGLAERDLMQILAAKPQHAVYILQRCFDCPQEEAKAAWNDFVLRYIDGPRVNRSLDLPKPNHLF